MSVGNIIQSMPSALKLLRKLPLSLFTVSVSSQHLSAGSSMCRKSVPEGGFAAGDRAASTLEHDSCCLVLVRSCMEQPSGGNIMYELACNCFRSGVARVAI